MRWRRTVLAAVLMALVAVAVGGPGEAAGAGAPGSGPPGLAGWRSDPVARTLWADPSRVAPLQVADALRGLDGETVRGLTRRHPGVIGNLGGVRPGRRYAANRAVAGDRFAGRQLLAYDPRGGGLVAEVLGDLEKADRIAIVVPGASVDADRFDREGGPARAARALMNRARRDGSTTRFAVIAWAGYRTPEGDGLEQARGGAARAGAARLSRLLAGIEVGTSASITLFCHSYGTVTCGLGAPYDAVVSDVVVYGSPGMRLGSAGQIGADTRLWAARGDSDWIRFVPHVRFGTYGHGTDPMDPAFGARRLDIGAGHGHGGYFDAGSRSLARFTDIAVGEIDAGRARS